MVVRCENFKIILAVFVISFAFAAAVPQVVQKKGSAYTQQALQEIKDRMLIPSNARVDRVSNRKISH